MTNEQVRQYLRTPAPASMVFNALAVHSMDSIVEENIVAAQDLPLDSGLSNAGMLSVVEARAHIRNEAGLA